MRLIICALALFGSQIGIRTGYAEQSASVERLPAFSWARVPRYMHIRKDTAFTPDEIQYLARFPLITFEKGTGARDSGTSEAGTLAAARAIKAIAPEVKTLFYRNVLVHYRGYAADAALSELGPTFLTNEYGEDKLVRGRVPAYDLSRPEVRDWWVKSAKQACTDPAIDGLFLDGNVKVLEPGYLLRAIGKARKDAVLDGYTAMVESTRQALGPEKLMIANVLRARFEDSGLSRLQAFDGSYIEAFETTVERIPVKDYVAKGIAAFQTAARGGSVIAFTAGLGDEGPDADRPEEARTDEIRSALKQEGDATDRRFRYLLGLFLICAEPHSYFYAHDGYDARTSTWWRKTRPEYERPLGAPHGPAVCAGYTYTREFAHASVMVDIERQIARIDWR